MLCGDVELNPRPNTNRNSWFNFSICHWNLNSLIAYNFQKVNLLEAYNTVNELNMICLSGCFLESSIQTENNNLEINGYKMVRADHPNILKKEVFVLMLGNFCQFVVLVLHV